MFQRRKNTFYFNLRHLLDDFDPTLTSILEFWKQQFNFTDQMIDCSNFNFKGDSEVGWNKILFRIFYIMFYILQIATYSVSVLIFFMDNLITQV